MKIDKRWLSLVLLVIPLLLIATHKSTDTATPKDGITFSDYVSVYVNGEYRETVKNTLTQTGENLIRLQLTATSADVPTNISVGNGTVTANTDTALNGLIRVNGLGGATCTIANASGYGNWSCSKQFTATGSQTVNTTGLYTPAGILFAVADITEVILQTNDQLTLNWSIDAS